MIFVFVFAYLYHNLCSCNLVYSDGHEMVMLVSNHDIVAQFATDRSFAVCFALVVPFVPVIIKLLLSQIDFLLFCLFCR